MNTDHNTAYDRKLASGNKDFHFSSNSILETDIIMEMRLLLYNSRNGHLPQIQLLTKLQELNKSIEQGYDPI